MPKNPPTSRPHDRTEKPTPSPNEMGRGSTEQPQPQQAARPRRSAGIGAYLILMVLAITVFAPIFNSDVLWSGYDLPQRSAYESMAHWTEAWTLDSIRSNDPITLTSYFLEEAIPFPPAMVHRAINLLLHLIAAILLLKNLKALNAPGALAAALVFAVHPAVLQTIFWAGYRTELLSLILILGALNLGIRNRGAADYFAMLAFSTLACLIHPAAMAIPVILSLVIIYQEQVFHLHSFNRVLPLLFIALFVGVWTQGGGPVETSESAASLAVSLNQAGQNMFFYLHQALFPVKIALFHPPQTEVSYQVGADMSLLPFFLFVPFYILMAVNYRKDWSRTILLGLTAYLALIFYGIGETGTFLDGSPAHENHAQYIALPAIMGLILCSAAKLTAKAGGGKLLWRIGISVLLFIQISITSVSAYEWGKPARMWQSMIELWPDSWVPKAALVDRAIATESDLLQAQQLIAMLESILEAKPELSQKRILLARTYAKVGHTTNALREYKRILRETDPDNAFLEEAARFYDQMGLSWEASAARKRIRL